MAESLQVASRNPLLARLFGILEFKHQCFINDLWEFVAFRTVSGNDELGEATNWLIKRLTELNVIAYPESLDVQLLSDSLQKVKMPQTIIGVLAENPGKPTILVYGHLDVIDAHIEEGWHSDPFVLTERDDYLYGRGTSSGKGPLLCWLNAIQIYKDAGVQLPVNIVFLIESMAHSNSLGLEGVIRNRMSLFRNVSCVCIAERRWLSNTKPCVIYGTHGLIYYCLEVEAAIRDTNGFDDGGGFKSLPDVFYLLSSLIIASKKGIFEKSPTETKLNENELNHQGLPRISIHDVDCSAHGDTPVKVVANFSVTLAPHQSPTEVTKLLAKHIDKAWQQRGSPNKMLLHEQFTMPAWTAKSNTPEYEAAKRANFDVYVEQPALIRDDGGMLVPSIFERCLGKNVIVLPIAGCDYCRGPTNERLAVDNYIGGSEMLVAFMYELSRQA